MQVLSLELLEKSLSEAPEYDSSYDVKKLGGAIPERIIDVFDRMMHAENTDELSNVSDEDVFFVVRHGKELAGLYHSDDFLTDKTFDFLSTKKSAFKRRVL